MLGIAPLLCTRLEAETHHRVVASDASQLAAGVVSAALTPELRRHMGTLCSSRMHAVMQPLLNVAPDNLETPAPHVTTDNMLHVAAPADAHTTSTRLDPVRRMYAGFYSQVRSTRWAPVLASPWRFAEHINALELRAVALALHWLLSYPSALGRRAFLLVDSTVALFSLLKGRSSAPSTMFVLRKIGALLLASSVSLLAGWVPSAVNPADAPSRLGGTSASQPSDSSP